MSTSFETDLSRKVTGFALYMALLPFPNLVTNVDKTFLFTNNAASLSFEFYMMLYNAKITKKESTSQGVKYTCLSTLSRPQTTNFG